MSIAGKLLFPYFIFFLLIILNSKSVFASSINISTGSAELKKDDEYSVQVTLSVNVQNSTQYYLRGVFAKQGSKNYCGFTWNGSYWFNGPYGTNSGWKNFLPVIVTNNSWTGQLKAKIDTDDSGCRDSGTYIFKIERFTSFGSGNFDSQNEQTVLVTLPTPTNTPTPTPIHSQNDPTKTAYTTAVPTLAAATAVQYSSSNITAAVNDYAPSDYLSATQESILGESTAASNSPTSFKKEKTKIKAIAKQKFPIFLALGGMILLVSCGIVSFQIVKKKRENIYTTHT